MPHVELSLIDHRRFRSGAGRVPNGSSAQAGTSATSADPARVPRSRPPAEAPDPAVDHTGGAAASHDADQSLLRWAAVVTGAAEPTVVISTDSLVVAASPACAELLSCGDPADMRGRCIRQALVHLVDFTDPPVPLDVTEVEKIPPLLALASGRLARGLIRVAPTGEERPRTLDAVSAPLQEQGAVVGSVTFFSKI